MPEADSMSTSVNGQSQVPPGFRFHPTEEELLQYYLRKKFAYEKIDLDVICDVDLNKLEPSDIQGHAASYTHGRLSTPQNDWYFFSHKDKKYPTGTRTNRATAAGFWKATGRDKVIYSNSRRIVMRKTLVFYKGRAPHGQKSDWIMHEYRLDDNITSTVDANYVCINAMGEPAQEQGWVVCRIFKKKNHHKNLDSPISISSISGDTRGQRLSSRYEGTLDLEHILQYMGRTSVGESGANHLHTRFLMLSDNDASITSHVSQESGLDRLVASHLNNGNEISKQEPPSGFGEAWVSAALWTKISRYNNYARHLHHPTGLIIVTNANYGASGNHLCPLLTRHRHVKYSSLTEPSPKIFS